MVCLAHPAEVAGCWVMCALSVRWGVLEELAARIYVMVAACYSVVEDCRGACGQAAALVDPMVKVLKRHSRRSSGGFISVRSEVGVCLHGLASRGRHVPSSKHLFGIGHA